MGERTSAILWILCMCWTHREEKVPPIERQDRNRTKSQCFKQNSVRSMLEY